MSEARPSEARRTASDPISMRIICCGNPERGDDSVGALVAARLRELGVEAETRTGAEAVGSQEKEGKEEQVFFAYPFGTLCPDEIGAQHSRGAGQHRKHRQLHPCGAQILGSARRKGVNGAKEHKKGKGARDR